MEVDYEKIWQEKWGEMQKYGPSHRHRRKIAKRILNDLSYQSVLDVGCGEGSNLAFLKSLKNNLKLTGIDISAQAINLAKKIIPEARFFQLDCQKEKLNEKFDLVFCSDVLEHLPDDEAAIKNIYEMTTKYCLVASVQGKMRNFEKQIGHQRNYQSGELVKKMRRAGFKILNVVEWGWPFYSPLYRDLLNIGKLNKKTEGKFGFFKKTISQFLYFLFLFNSFKKGDVIFILAGI